MTDIYDIKLQLWQFIYSIDYIVIIFSLLFFIIFYLILKLFFKEEKENIKIDTKDIINKEIKRRFDYIISNIDNFSREIFYREVSIFLRFVISKKNFNNNIFFMTITEVKNNIKSEFIEDLEKVYFLEFNHNLEDNITIRKKIIEKINTKL